MIKVHVKRILQKTVEASFAFEDGDSSPRSGAIGLGMGAPEEWCREARGDKSPRPKRRRVADLQGFKVEAILVGLGLRLKDGGVLNRCDLGIPLLGFTIYLNRVCLNRDDRKRLCRRLGEVERGWSRGEIEDGELQSQGQALFAHAKTGDDIEWLRTVLEFSPLEGRET